MIGKIVKLKHCIKRFILERTWSIKNWSNAQLYFNLKVINMCYIIIVVSFVRIGEVIHQ